MIPIVFVETGRRPSKYLKNNLIMLREKFPQEKIILIMSEEFLDEVNISNVEIVSEETLPESSLLNEFESIQKSWSGLQKNYWTNTTKRFKPPEAPKPFPVIKNAVNNTRPRNNPPT